ncbi:DUF829-domain-containing protein [Penicillium cinerascens]|uniref:DUF829-domain-containing protein n=1 Tax=Penicillium cinerascens TaxID=70096 RepID=A0A9W9NDK5_9EURO|nr:DUF829-domain-containing protein [Penicillium cinerascens]KAJ5217917.1 DUF829-domain-containing protein [Penicillium cinerascens]
MAPKPLHFPGFTPISERIYLRNGHERTKSPSAHDPTRIVIFGWGDGMPKHVSKYARGYHDIFPCAKIIVVLSSTLQASAQPLDSRIDAMSALIDIVFTPPNDSSGNEERILLHAMSNTGAIFLAATLVAYQQRHGGDRRAPHTLLVFDSTPGSLNFTSQVSRWSRAMALGTSMYFPWLFGITQALWYIVLWGHRVWEWIRGIEPSGIWANRILNDTAVSPIETHRLYLYSKEDDIIWWEDLVQNVVQARNLGYKADLEMFKGSPHVGHMRLHPEQYWNVIFNAWKKAWSTN